MVDIEKLTEELNINSAPLYWSAPEIGLRYGHHFVGVTTRPIGIIPAGSKVIAWRLSRRSLSDGIDEVSLRWYPDDVTLVSTVAHNVNMDLESELSAVRREILQKISTEQLIEEVKERTGADAVFSIETDPHFGFPVASVRDDDVETRKFLHMLPQHDGIALAFIARREKRKKRHIVAEKADG